MDKEKIDLMFDRVFPLAVQEGVRDIRLPSDDVLEASWKTFCHKFANKKEPASDDHRSNA